MKPNTETNTENKKEACPCCQGTGQQKPNDGCSSAPAKKWLVDDPYHVDCSEYSDWGKEVVTVWGDYGPYYDGDDYLICQQHELDEEVLHSQVGLARINRQMDEAFQWSIAKLLFVIGIVVLGLSLGQYIRGLIGI